MFPDSSTKIETARAALTALVIALLLAALTPATMLWDQDEGYYARTAAEMLQTGNWLIPTFNGELFAHKPPLSYWLLAISMAVFGANEFAARLPSAIALSGSAFLIFLIGRRMFNARVGWWAMAILSTALLPVYLGIAAMVDAPLLFSICLAIWAYVEMTWDRKRIWPMLAVFGLGVYLSLMVKGPVGPAVVITTVAASWLLLPAHQRVPFRYGVALAAASLAALLLFFLWAIPANRISGGDLLSQGVGIHVVGRALSAMEGHGGSGWAGYLATLPIYIPVLVLGFLPWTIHMPAAAHGLLTGWIGDRRERVVLWSWMTPTFVMFTLAATKLPHYIFPMFPAVALAVAAAIVATGEKDIAQTATGDRRYFWFRIGRWFYLLSGLAGSVIVAISPLLLPGVVGWPVALPLAGLLLAAHAFAARPQLAGRPLATSRAVLLVTPAVLFCLIWSLVPRIEPVIKAAKPMALEIAGAVEPQTRIYAQGYFEPSFIFYLDRPFDNPVLRIGESEAELDRVLADDGKIVLVTTRQWLEAAEARAGGRLFDVLFEHEALNVNRGARLQKLVAAVRGAAH